MPTTFLVADTHFGHRNILTFRRSDGTPLRPYATIEEHDEALVENWNRVVGPHDKVYHLGDVVINRRALATMARLNGDKVLIKGNHDIFKLNDYTPYFRDIRAYHVMDRAILSHVPVHPDSFPRFRGNIHGHLHSNRVIIEPQLVPFPDPNYVCVSMEHIDFTPIAWDVVRTMLPRVRT